MPQPVCPEGSVIISGLSPKHRMWRVWAVVVVCVVVATVLNVQAVYRARGVVSDLFEAVPSCALTVIDNANQPPAPGKHGFMWKEGAVWVPASCS